MTARDLDGLTRDELIARAEKAGVERAPLLTRPELVDEIVRRSVSDPEEQRRARGLFGRARDLLARVVERGLHLPDAAARIRGPGSGGFVSSRPPLATVLLAEIYTEQGHHARAVHVLDEVLIKEPDHRAASELRSRILAQHPEGLGPIEEPKDTMPPPTMVSTGPRATPAIVVTAVAADAIAASAAPPGDDASMRVAAPALSYEAPQRASERTQSEPTQEDVSAADEGSSSEESHPHAEAQAHDEPHVHAEAQAHEESAPAASDPTVAGAFDIPISPVQEVPARELAAGASAASAFMLDDEPLPPRYDVDELVVMPVDPVTLYLYWEVREESAASAAADFGAGLLVVRLLAVQGTWHGPVAQTRDIEVQTLLGDWFIRDLPAGAAVRAAVGWRTPTQFVPLAVTLDATAPPEEMSRAATAELVDFHHGESVAFSELRPHLVAHLREFRENVARSLEDAPAARASFTRGAGASSFPQLELFPIEQADEARAQGTSSGAFDRTGTVLGGSSALY